MRIPITILCVCVFFFPASNARNNAERTTETVNKPESKLLCKYSTATTESSRKTEENKIKIKKKMKKNPQQFHDAMRCCGLIVYVIYFDLFVIVYEELCDRLYLPVEPVLLIIHITLSVSLSLCNKVLLNTKRIIKKKEIKNYTPMRNHCFISHAS